MASTYRNFKNIFSRPLFTIIFRPEMLKFHPYSILTGDTRVNENIAIIHFSNVILAKFWTFICKLKVERKCGLEWWLFSIFLVHETSENMYSGDTNSVNISADSFDSLIPPTPEGKFKHYLTDLFRSWLI